MSIADTRPEQAPPAWPVTPRLARHDDPAERPVPAERDQLLPLTSLRFVAAAMIVLLHTRVLFPFSKTWGDPLNLSMAVSFFFVLSGFIMVHAYPVLDAAGTRRFLVARLARLWPVHVATFLLMLPMVPVYRQWMQGSTPSTALANLALVHAWVPYPDSYFSFDAPSWSISTEFAFYLAFPLLIRGWRRTWLPKLLVSIVLLGVMENTGRLLGLPTSLSGQPGADVVGMVNVNPLANVHLFVFGMVTWLAWHHLEPRLKLGVAGATVLEIAALGAVVWTLTVSVSLKSAVAEASPWLAEAAIVWVPGLPSGVVSFPLLILVMALRRGVISRLLSHRGPVLLGEISYALYLVHQPCTLAFGIGLGYVAWLVNDVTGPMLYAAYWLGALGAAWALWRWVERPARGFVRGWWRANEPQLSPGQWRAVAAGAGAALLVILAIDVAWQR